MMASNGGLYGSISDTLESGASKSTSSTEESPPSSQQDEIQGSHHGSSPSSFLLRRTRTNDINATVLSEVAGITQTLIGGGVLSLSSGIAVFANDPKAVAVAFVWVTVLGTVFGYFCLL